MTYDQTPANPLLARQQGPVSEPQRTEDRKRFEQDVDALSRLVDKYRVDSQRFFAGDVKLPPDELRERIASELRRLQNSKLGTSADSFRIGALEGRFNSHLELFGRRLREREMGTGAVRRDERPAPRHDPARGVLISEAGAVEALYKGLFDHGAAARSMDLERFRGHLRQQAEAIRTQTGCSDIQFRIAEENGKKKIKAKPIKAA